MKDPNINKVIQISDALNKKYPDGKNPFQIMTRLAEEIGELATEVNHFEKSGSKVKKLGPPNKERIADEAKDVIHVVLQLIRYYNLEDEIEKLTEKSIDKYKKEGLIK